MLMSIPKKSSILTKSQEIDVLAHCTNEGPVQVIMNSWIQKRSLPYI